MDTEPGALERPRKRLQFEPTINAGHLLSLISMLGALAVGWNTLDKRVAVLEDSKLQQTSYQRERDAAQDQVIREKFDQIKEGLNEVKQVVNELRRQSR